MAAIFPVMEMGRGELYSALAREIKTTIDTFDEALNLEQNMATDIIIEKRLAKFLQWEAEHSQTIGAHHQSLYRRLIQIDEANEQDARLTSFKYYDRLGELPSLIENQQAIFLAPSDRIEVFRKIWAAHRWLRMADEKLAPQMKAEGFMVKRRSAQHRKHLTNLRHAVYWAVDMGLMAHLQAQVQRVFCEAVHFHAYGSQFMPSKSQRVSNRVSSGSTRLALELFKMSAPFLVLGIGTLALGSISLAIELAWVHRTRMRSRIRRVGGKLVRCLNALMIRLRWSKKSLRGSSRSTIWQVMIGMGNKNRIRPVKCQIIHIHRKKF